MTSEPLTDEQLAALRTRAEEAYAAIQAKYPKSDLKAWYWLRFSPWEETSASYVLYLLDEVERLRTFVRHVLAIDADTETDQDGDEHYYYISPRDFAAVLDEAVSLLDGTDAHPDAESESSR